eukprot:397507_1
MCTIPYSLTSAIYLIFAVTSSEYYLSYNAFTWDAAELFCQSHCSSNLASIHSYSDVVELQLLLNNRSANINMNINDVWIGLVQNGSDQFKWSDNTPFNWGNNKITDIITSNPEYVLTYNTVSDKYEFANTYNSSTERSFVCNECKWDILTKYVYINTQLDFAAAELKCNDEFGTHIASIHSETDMQQVRLISDLSSYIGAGIYIGLNDKLMQNNLIWVDDTTLDYIPDNSDMLLDYNLSTLAFNNAACVMLDTTANYEWTVAECINNYNIICNAPTNILCDKDNWNIDSEMYWTWSDNCDVYNTNFDLKTNAIKNTFDDTYRLWTKLSLEYVFKMDLNSNHSDISSSGIVINFQDSVNETIDMVPYYIGVNMKENGDINLFIRNKISKIMIESDDISSEMDLLNDDNILRIEFDENATFTFILNDDETILLPQNVGNNISENYYIKSMNVQNVGISSWSRALYYNGWGNYSVTYTTQSPTPAPTPRPVRTRSPTADCSMDNAIYAQWSDSYLSIYIYIPNKHNRKKRLVDRIIMDENALTNKSDCNALFEPETLDLLVGAECFWVQ